MPLSQRPATLIEGGMVIAHDGERHRLIDNGVVAYRDDRIVHVGKSYSGPVAERISAAGKIIIPGFISAHSHVSMQTGSRLILDHGRPPFSRALFLNYLPATAGSPSYLDRPDHRLSAEFGFAALLQHGITTVVNFAPGGPSAGEDTADIARRFGIRLYYSPVATSARYEFDRTGQLRTEWDEGRGLAELDKAERFIEKLETDAGLVRPIVMVDELLLTSPELLSAARAVAERHGTGLTLHAAEQAYEFHHVLREKGRTPVEFLADLGVLSPKTIIAHCLMVGGHRDVGHPHSGDLQLLGCNGTTVAHCPVVQARRGYGLENYDAYKTAGVNIALGADTWPLDLFQEMRMAALLGKLKTGRYDAAVSLDIFNSATLAGAAALGRPDLGKLCQGAAADIVLVSADSFHMQPMRDPVQALVHLATAGDVDTVIVAGKTVVDQRRLVFDPDGKILRHGMERARIEWQAFGNDHWSHVPTDDIFPPPLTPWEGETEPTGMPA